MSAGPDVFLFVGSYAGRISTLSFSPAKAALTVVHATDKAGKSPSWLAAHPTSERILLASDENDGQIVAFEVAPSGELRHLKTANAGGAGTVTVDVSPNGRSACAANYSGSSLATLALQPNGIPWPPSLAVHPFVVEQPGPDSGRQSASFPHQALYDPTGHFVFITDLGADLVRIFSTSPGSGTGAAEPLTTVTLERGSGPRHMAFLSAPSQKPPTHLYVLCELSNTVLVFSLDYAEDFSTVSLALLQTTSTRLGDAPSPAGCIALASELAVHTGHGLLFAGNRWRHRESGAPPLGVNDDVAVFAIDDTKRTLSPLRMHGLGASNVRHFEISPCGEWMAVAGQGSGIVKVFAIQGWREAASVEVEAAAVVRWWRK